MVRVKKAMEKENQKRFVLVHGICHGAWTWYKVKTQLEAAGHCVTAVDLAARFLRSIPREEWSDTMCGRYGKPDCPLDFTLLGPKYMAKKMYQLSPLQDLVLAKMLVRVNPLVTDSLAGTKSFSEEGYGCITRIYIVCGEDLSVPEDYQRWMIQNFPPEEVMEIKDADHMAMFSQPKELCGLLLDIADKYA